MKRLLLAVAIFISVMLPTPAKAFPLHCNVFASNVSWMFPGSLYGHGTQQCSGTFIETEVGIQLQSHVKVTNWVLGFIPHSTYVWQTKARASQRWGGYSQRIKIELKCFLNHRGPREQWRIVMTGQALRADGMYGVSVRSLNENWWVCH